MPDEVIVRRDDFTTARPVIHSRHMTMDSDAQKRFLSADRPIVDRSEDKLGRKAFAESIALAIRGWKGRDSLVIALYGPWGSGKSSVKNMITDTLRETKGESPTIVEFDPWEFANRERLTEVFFDQVGIALGRGSLASKKDRARLLRRWQRYAAYLTMGSGLLDLVKKPIEIILWIVALVLFVVTGARPAQGWWISGIPTVIFAAVAAGLRWSARFSSLVARWFEIGAEIGKEPLEEVKTELARSLASLPNPILVILDDLDRLTPRETIEIFQLVKANADFPNLVYIVLFDRATVENHLEEVLKVSGHEYLEKVVQVGFDIPLLDRPRMEKILFSGLDQVIEADPAAAARFDVHRWGNLFMGALREYFGTLRDVNRFLSTVAFHFSLFRSEGSFEVNPVDLIGIEVLRVFEPDVYHALPRAKEQLTRVTGLRDSQTDEERRVVIQLVDRSPPERRERVREVIRQLFPPAEWALGGMSYGSGFSEEWVRDLRVCARETFDRYFAFATPEGDISQAAIERILRAASDRDSLRTELRALKGQGLLDVAMDRLEAYKTKIPAEHAEAFVTALFDVGDSLSVEERSLSALSPKMHAVRVVYWHLRQERNPERRLEVLRTAIRNTDGLSQPVRFVSLEEPDKKRSQEPEEQLVSESGLEELKLLCVEKIREAAREGRLLSNTDLAMILYRWREWGDPQEVREFCSGAAKTRDGALALVRAFTSISVSSGMGDYVARRQWTVRLSNVEEFLDWRELESTLRDVKSDDLNESEKRGVEAFRRAIQRRAEGKPEPGPLDTEDEED